MMSFGDSLKLALQGVGSNKFRSFLTLLGIIVGVSAVILMVSLGSGTQQVVGGQFEDIMSRQIFIYRNWNIPYQQMGKLHLDDEKYIEEVSLSVEDVVPFFETYRNIEYAGKEEENTIAGVLPNVLELTNLTLEYGCCITEDDLQSRKRVAVVGRKILERLTDSRDYYSMLGDKITLDGKEFIIVGILGEASSTVLLGNNSVLVPQNTYIEIWCRRNKEASSFLISYPEDVSEKEVIAEVSYLLDKKYGKVKEQSRFIIEGLQGSFDSVNRVITIFSFVLAGIAAISLLVGGIGVMNIMLVTVKERTREIGIRRAIGATCHDIQRQFLEEAVMLSIGGGILGILVGCFLSLVVNFFLAQSYEWWQCCIPLWVILVSFGVTLFIGVVFGFYPAYKASKLDPIEALRYE